MVDRESHIISHYQGFNMIHNRLNGEGTIYLTNGSQYEGEMKSGTLHGPGKYTWPDSVVYKGDFYEGRITGKGRYEWPDGTWYSGQVKNGRKHGFGSYCDGKFFMFYVGNWSEDEKHGTGRLDYNAEGTWYYNGDWYENKRHGLGVQHFESGSIYNGEWKDGRPHGWGTMYFSENEQLFEGMWRNGQRCGHGEQYWMMKPLPSVCVFQHHCYKGSWVGDKRNGFGIFIYADGCKYEGYWKDDRKSGIGIFFHKNGARFQYEFDEDKIIDKMELSGRIAVGPYRDVDDGMLLFCPDVNMVLPALDKYDWTPDKLKIRNLILTKITSLRYIYYVYSNLGKTEDSISSGVLDTFRFLQMCRDFKFDQFGWSLGRVMNVLRTGSNRIAWSKKKLIPWKFVRKLIVLSYRLFNETCDKDVASPITYLHMFITNHIDRWNKRFNGVLFKDPDRACFLMEYIQSLCTIYERVCAVYQGGNAQKNITVRQFASFVNDIGVRDICDLSTKDLVDLLHFLMPCFKTNSLYDFDLQMTPLDFVDAILLIGEAFYSKLTLSQSKEICGKYNLTESSEGFFTFEKYRQDKHERQLETIMDTISVFKAALSGAEMCIPYEDNRLLMHAKDKSRDVLLEAEFDIEPVVLTRNRSQKSVTSGSEGNLYTNVMKHFSFEKIGDMTGEKERDFWVLKLRRFIQDLFQPLANYWILIHAKVDWLQKEEAELNSIESFSNIILPHSAPSTVWFDES